MRYGTDTLLLIPCCAEKQPGGGDWDSDFPSIADTLGEAHNILLSTRRELLLNLKGLPPYTNGKYAKNIDILLGPDFGGDNVTGQYRPALERYVGSLYKAGGNWSGQVKSALLKPGAPGLLILSALYGLLHPLELIQDYNLQMSDKPARTNWNEQLPLLLKAFVENTKAKRIVMYFGSSTAYLKVALRAVKPLLNIGSLKVLYYDVEKGNAYHTPHNHGLMLLQDLTDQEPTGYTRPVTLRRYVG